MKKQLFGLALLLSLSTSFAGNSFAAELRPLAGQEQHRDHDKNQDRSKERSDKLAKELDLSNKQKSKLEKIFQDQHQQMQALHSRSGRDRSQTMAEAKRIHESTDKKLKDVLSKKQYAQFEAKRQDRMRQMSRPGQGSRRTDNHRDFGSRDRS
ncbi:MULTISPECIES: hypothetical protein [Hymenobacter]|uniref:DUF4890 domain-containing protein n=1 Tax=Hymenobacter jejuensis TaxID=2502781 RepID=A0A5B7ZYX4_9BACT|nr:MULTISPECIES: hypothetical protein [Hymenobacter]MBC6991907.1 hypothetical protein [Hymenobacter sp. BT491]QDA60228.1 hypothetical protein FHG12_08940 [Hymenobacter jejuensis]